jgi:hypothetical protein
MKARFYPRGIGHAVRGLFLDGQEVFYRTKKADAQYQQEQLYGRDAAEYLARWDAGQSVFTINLGGLGPGYDQVIQIAMFEVLRWLLDHKPDLNDGEWKHDIAPLLEPEVFKNERIKKLGLSGAQWGAACQLASRIYYHGPIKVLDKSKNSIQTSDNIRFVGIDCE